MTHFLTLSAIASELRQFDAKSDLYASQVASRVIEAAIAVRCSDVHLQPLSAGLMIQFRIDGVLQTVGTFPRGEGSDVINRLKVMAGLLTYRSDSPQEGRILLKLNTSSELARDIRLCTLPTLYGERAVLRLFSGISDLKHLDDLGLPQEIADRLSATLIETSGAIIISGSAGSGKTTTAYACLREIIKNSDGGRSVVSLEDPIECPIEGVAQSQINPNAGWDLTDGLKSLLRQDPEVIFVSEMRDRMVMATVFNAALTGQLVLTTMHAGSSAEAIRRLIDAGLEPYQLRSSVQLIITQKLVRRLCSHCTHDDWRQTILFGNQVASRSAGAGCPVCRGTGYDGRVVIAEALPIIDGVLAESLISSADTRQIATVSQTLGMTDLRHRGAELVASGQTTAEEIVRCLGISSA